METINAIIPGVGGGVPEAGSFRQETPTTQTSGKKDEPQQQQKTADDGGVSVTISEEAAKQLKLDQAKKTAQQQAEKQQAQQPAPPPPPPPAEEEAAALQNFSFYESNIELAKKRADANAQYDAATEKRLSDFASYTNQYLVQVAYVQGLVNAPEQLQAPNPPTLVERLDLLA